MDKSETITDLVSALAVAQGQFSVLAYNKSNPHFKSRYADLTAVIAATRPALAANGLAVMQFPSADGAVVSVETVLSHKSGQWVSGRTTLTASKADAQGVGAAITYAKRYGLSAILCVSSEEDDDGNGAVDAPPARREAAPRAETKPEGSPKMDFIAAVKAWSGAAPEDMKAACKAVADFAKIDLAKATDADFVKLCGGVKARVDGGLSFADFVKEPK